MAHMSRAREAEPSDALRQQSDPPAAGIPGLSLPAGLTKAGLPVGLELDGPVGSDLRLLALGMAIETTLGVLPPPNI